MSRFAFLSFFFRTENYYLLQILIITWCTCFGSTYTKIGTIQRRLAWPLRKDDTQNREAFHIFWSRICLIFDIQLQCQSPKTDLIRDNPGKRLYFEHRLRDFFSFSGSTGSIPTLSFYVAKKLNQPKKKFQRNC